MDSWSDLRAKALKILGDGAKVPDLPNVFVKANEDVSKKLEEFEKSRDECEAKLLAKQNANSAVLNSLKQFGAKIEKSDFELDPKNKNNVKKIQNARKLLTDGISHVVKYVSDDDKMLDELDKHMIQLGKYKPKSGSL